ncbi:MAG: hypothetical protein QG587_76 [Chloroflexota bacterium]|nr:hypothetical protein [Chloroflexota bacterium]
MGDRTGRLAGILEEAHEVHAVETRRTNGVDPDWALFYAWWLLNWSDFPGVLGRSPSLAELTVELAALDAAYRAGPRDRPWPAAYAIMLTGPVS